MALSDYLVRFRSLSTEALLEKQVSLEAQDTIYQSQSLGTRSFARDLRMMNEQLNAIAYVLRERSPVTQPTGEPSEFVGTTDFSASSRAGAYGPNPGPQHL